MKNTYKADVSELYKALDDMKNAVSDVADPKTLAKLSTCFEEMFVNVAMYAYEDKTDAFIDVEVLTDESSVTIIIEDAGVPFDPLSKPDPDMEEYFRERRIGGLGIKLVKKMMDEVAYEYKGGRNVLKLIKNINS